MSKEMVREKMLNYLKNELKVPEKGIELDVSLTDFEENEEGTIDILVSHIDADDFYNPIMIIECLDKNTPIDIESGELDETIDKLGYFDQVVTAGRIVLANEDSMLLIRHDDATGEYYIDEKMPNYEKMVQELEYILANPPEHNHHHDHDHGCGCGHGHNDDEGGCGCGDDCGCR